MPKKAPDAISDIDQGLQPAFFKLAVDPAENFQRGVTSLNCSILSLQISQLVGVEGARNSAAAFNRSISRETSGALAANAKSIRKRREAIANQLNAIYLGRHLGGHKHEDIGKAVGLDKTSSVSSACILMKGRVAKEQRLVRRVRRIEEALTKS